MNKRNPNINKRCRQLQSGNCGDGPVVYWMSRDQRTNDNWALLWAQQEAIIRGKGLIVIFCLISDYLKASSAHYSFMLDGLEQTKISLEKNNISFYLLKEDPTVIIPHFLIDIDAHLLVCDFDPLRIKQQWKENLAKKLAVPIFEVDTHNIIPVWIASDKKEYAAYTLRPKINRLIDEFLTEIPSITPHPIIWESADRLFNRYHTALFDLANRSSFSRKSIEAGEKIATEVAQNFIDKRLSSYSNHRNNPCLNGQSGLSPYLHFGQLSAQRLALQVTSIKTTNAQSKEEFLEELIVRKELADNYCYYEKQYDQFEAFPNWAQQSLNAHRKDKRDYIYSFEQLEEGGTHEELWNACQRDLVKNSKLHGFLRMYWAKKILEWTPSPEIALEYSISLNDRYSLDGRDPNGYAGIAWSIGGVHDRAWKERPIFGKVRYMNEAGCRRKFKTKQYIESIQPR